MTVRELIESLSHCDDSEMDLPVFIVYNDSTKGTAASEPCFSVSLKKETGSFAYVISAVCVRELCEKGRKHRSDVKKELCNGNGNGERPEWLLRPEENL